MEITQTLHVTNPKDWRNWLKKNHKTKKEIWLVYYKKGTGKRRIEYNDAVEQALCFGWVDSTVKSLDKERTVQRFSPRKPKAKGAPEEDPKLRALLEKFHGEVIDVIKPEQ